MHIYNDKGHKRYGISSISSITMSAVEFIMIMPNNAGVFHFHAVESSSRVSISLVSQLLYYTLIVMHVCMYDTGNTGHTYTDIDQEIGSMLTRHTYPLNRPS